MNCSRTHNTITNVEVTIENKTTVIHITSNQPSLIIGKGGRDIEELQKFLCKELNENIKINLLECKLWHKIYEDDFGFPVVEKGGFYFNS